MVPRKSMHFILKHLIIQNQDDFVQDGNDSQLAFVHAICFPQDVPEKKVRLYFF